MPHSYSPTCHQVVFESLQRLSQYLKISPAISSGDPEWSLHMPRELGQRFGKLSFDFATWKDICSMVTKYCLQLYYLSLLSVTIPVLDKEKTRHFLPNFFYCHREGAKPANYKFYLRFENHEKCKTAKFKDTNFIHGNVIYLK